MKDRSAKGRIRRGEQAELGDISPEEFRRQLHEIADWIADYRANIETLPVAPNTSPGAIHAALPSQPPEQGEPFERVFADFKQLIVPGLLHWTHPQFAAYFGS